MSRRRKFALLLLSLTLLLIKTGISRTTNPWRQLPRNVNELTIVTAASQNHARVLVEWFDAHSFIEDTGFKVFVYDLGLSDAIKTEIDLKHTWFRWRKFNFSRYPSHVDIHFSAGCYAWKAIILQELASTAQFLLWLDSGVRLADNRSITSILDHITSQGYYTVSTGPSVQKWVHETTQSIILGAKATEYASLDMANGAVMGFISRSSILNEFINCSLNRDCICPHSSSRRNHRQDQAVITLLLYKHFGRNLVFPEHRGWHTHSSIYEQVGDSVENFSADSPNIHVVSVATLGTNAKRLATMEASCTRYGMTAHVLGKNETWKGFKWMFEELVVPELRQIPESHLVVVMDAVDVLIQSSSHSINELYYSKIPNADKVVLALETSCPNDECEDVIETMMSSSGIPNLQHVNGGWLLGPPLLVGSILMEIAQHGDPQVRLGQYARRETSKVHMDTTQEFCACIVTGDGVDEWHLNYDVRRVNGKNRIVNAKSGIMPAFCHFPGTQEALRRRQDRAFRLVAWDEAVESVATT